MGLKVFYFIATMGARWRQIVDEQLATIERSGLYDAAEVIYVCQTSRSKIRLPAKYQARYFSKTNQFEFPALHMVKEFTAPGDTVLYLHTKGASRTGPRAQAGDRWREYLMWGCVERWREHVAALDSCDVSGVQLTTLNDEFATKCGARDVYAGNFWWATGDYLEKLAHPEITANRWGAEGWIMGASPRCNDLHNLTGGGMITEKNTFSLPDFGRHEYDPRAARLVETRHEIINALIRKFGYQRYLEIGVYHFDCFNRVQCACKECVDPGVPKATHVITSDAFFARNKQPWDIVFIDGLHTEEQAYRDVQNALACLAPGGSIICHDCDPETEWEQRDTTNYDGNGVWVGTVWRAFARLRCERKDLSMVMVDSDFGCGIIRKGSQEPHAMPTGGLTYPYFVQHRRELMNVLDPEGFYPWLQKLA